jgi:hypothetical protein
MSAPITGPTLTQYFAQFEGPQERPSTAKRVLLYFWLIEAQEAADEVRKQHLRQGMTREQRGVVEALALDAGQRRFDELVAAYETHFGRPILEPLPETVHRTHSRPAQGYKPPDNVRPFRKIKDFRM